MLQTGLRKVYLHGSLGKEFGEFFELQVESCTEAIRLLEANFPNKFANKVREGEFHVIRGSMEDGKFLSEDTVQMNLGKADLHIVPVVAGSKSGAMKVITGIALIALSFAMPGIGFAALMAGASAGTAGAIAASGSVIMSLGISMALSGVASMLAPKVKNYGDRETPDERASFISNGPVNASEQGGPVPIVYGRIRVGSVVIASSVSTEQL